MNPTADILSPADQLRVRSKVLKDLKATKWKLAIIDDAPEVRQLMREAIVEHTALEVEAVEIAEGPEGDVRDFLQNDLAGFNAVVTDFELQHNAYSKFRGDDVAAEANREDMPGILCSYQINDAGKLQAKVERHNLGYIPLAVTNQTIVHHIDDMLRTVLEEHKGLYTEERQPSWTVAHIKAVRGEYLELMVAGRPTSETLHVPQREVPKRLHHHCKPNGQLRVLANVGADSPASVFLLQWGAVE